MYTYCFEGCSYKKSDWDNFYIICTCPSSSLMEISEVDELQPYENENEFTSSLKKGVLNSLSCGEETFKKDNAKKNSGLWIATAIILLQIPAFISFGTSGFSSLYSFLNSHSNDLIGAPEVPSISQSISNDADIVMGLNPPKKNNNNLQEDINSDLNSINNNDHNNPKTSNSEYFESERNINPDANTVKVSGNKRSYLNIMEKKQSHYVTEKVSSKNMLSEGSSNSNMGKTDLVEKEKPKYDDVELDLLPYEEVVENDRRGWLINFWRICKYKIFFLSPWFNLSVFEPLGIKIAAMLLIFSSFFVFAALLFDSKYVTNRFLGSKSSIANFNSTEIDKVLLGSLICFLFSCGIDFLVNSKKQFLEILVKVKEHDEFLLKSKGTLKRYKITLIIFIIFNFIFMLFFWYFVSNFCQVYRQTQANWIGITF